MDSRLFAVERYDRADGSPEPVTALATEGTRLVSAVRLVADDVVLALVEGPDEPTVAAAAARAGWRVDRLTPAEWLEVTA
ncbi:hypothetical protein [Actinokineospora bangkokensis]|uniref:Uncharacterized protein n=1 Tax=Actinokineospora bangkokensis TaxID=1193682 RepID=A0A1Q9LRL9_9PSEU|nr:hypothetical protein [Actinokineospora bangkokensis]OLR94658.1 hypothetical protein BJP25_13130 [Actinokineospora bangkokensis]